MRLGGLTRAPKRTNQYAKAYEEVRQGVLTGSSRRMEQKQRAFSIICLFYVDKRGYTP